MNYKVLLQHSETQVMYDITTLCNEIKYTAFLKGQPGKLTFTLEKDPNDVLQVASGSKIMFTVDGYGIFYGYVFTIGTDAQEIYQLTAYDQLRYLKNQEILITKEESASEIFARICQLGNMQCEIKYPTSYIIPRYLHDKKTRYAIIEYGMDEHYKATGEQCFVRDDYGTLIFSELKNEKTDLILGDDSLLTGYDYEISIDKDTFNQVVVVKQDQDLENCHNFPTYGEDTQKLWGTLQYILTVDKDTNEGKIKELAENLLKVKNRETQSLKLTALGIKEFRPGTGFVLALSSLDIRQYMYVESVTHTFTFDYHLMELEVSKLEGEDEG